MNPHTDYIFGIRAVLEAIHSGKEIEKILIRKDLNGELFQELAILIRDRNIPVQNVPIERLNRITRKNHQGVIAFIAPIQYQQIESIIPGIYEKGKSPFILILDSITDVRNIGAIARSAECGGVDAIIVPEKGSAQINADAIKTSAGALHYIPVCRVRSLTQTARFLKDSGLNLIAASEKAEQHFYRCDFTKPVALILGSEDTGISHELLKVADTLMTIPVAGSIGSLNVSAAATVLIYEVWKQRNT